MSYSGNINRHGYYLSPNTGRTQLIQKAPQQQYVNVETPSDFRIIRKYFSSIAPCNESGGSGYIYTANISGAVRNLIGVRFLSLQLDFTPAGTIQSENTGFVFLQGGLQAREAHSETASGQKYTAKFPFPSCVSPEEPSRQYEYTWQQNYFQSVEHSTSIDKIQVNILKEDSTNGELVPMTNVIYSNLELELYLAINTKQTY
jgi:hypothetical protein